jgi:hypothetical protein
VVGLVAIGTGCFRVIFRLVKFKERIMTVGAFYEGLNLLVFHVAVITFLGHHRCVLVQPVAFGTTVGRPETGGMAIIAENPFVLAAKVHGMPGHSGLALGNTHWLKRSAHRHGVTDCAIFAYDFSAL